MSPNESAPTDPFGTGALRSTHCKRRVDGTRPFAPLECRTSATATRFERASPPAVIAQRIFDAACVPDRLPPISGHAAIPQGGPSAPPVPRDGPHHCRGVFFLARSSWASGTTCRWRPCRLQRAASVSDRIPRWSGRPVRHSTSLPSFLPSLVIPAKAGLQ